MKIGKPSYCLECNTMPSSVDYVDDDKEEKRSTSSQSKGESIVLILMITCVYACIHRREY